MRRILKPAFLIALAASASILAAQESDTDALDLTDELSLGEPVGPQVGEPYVREVFDDWSLRCVKSPEGQTDPCNLYQLLFNDDGVAVAEFNLFPLPEGSRPAAGATIVAPLETLLTQQLTIAVDGQNARRYPFTFCNRDGCVARMGFTEAEVDEMKRGANATVRLVPAVAPTSEVVLNVSLTGFTAALESVAAE